MQKILKKNCQPIRIRIYLGFQKTAITQKLAFLFVQEEHVSIGISVDMEKST